MMCDNVKVDVVPVVGGGLAVSKPACKLGYSMDSPMCQNAHHGHGDPCPHFIKYEEDEL